jgi:hypothetical protein
MSGRPRNQASTVPMHTVATPATTSNRVMSGRWSSTRRGVRVRSISAGMSAFSKGRVDKGGRKQ